MGAMGDAMTAYAEPLVEATDGSPEAVQKAFSMAMVCWNLSLLDEGAAAESIDEMRSTLQMSEDEFRAFRHDVIERMIRRHRDMFPGLHSRPSGDRDGGVTRTIRAASVGRNDLCPCGSGKKYKKCCLGSH